MIAYKGFNEHLVCTLGNKPFQYEVGQTYKESLAQCRQSGFHCVEEPIEVLRWYRGNGARYCVVEAGGDINEDGENKIACTEMTIIKELTLEQIGILECQWMMKHPTRVYSSIVARDFGHAQSGDIVVVRGTNPRASGEKDSTIFLLKEGKGRKIVDAGAYRIDGKKYKVHTQYDVEGGVYCDKERTKKIEGLTGYQCNVSTSKGRRNT